MLQEYLSNIAKHKETTFPLSDENQDFPIIHMSEHLMQTYTDNHGRVLSVFDKLLSNNELHSIRTYMVHLSTRVRYSGYTIKGVHR